MPAKKNKASPVGIVLSIVIIMLLIAAILFCIYFFKQNGAFDNNSNENIIPHVINKIEEKETEVIESKLLQTELISETTTEVTTLPITETEPVTETEAIPTDNYDEAFFENVFMVGDSLFTGLVHYEYLLPEQVFAQIGLTPSSVMTKETDGMTVYDKASEFSPEYICIMLGTNGIAYLEPDFMAEKMSSFIDELMLSCFESEVILISIPPVTSEYESDKPKTLETIKIYNELIKNLAEEKSIVYIDIFNLLCDENEYLSEKYAENDGLHLKIHAYPIILSAIQHKIENVYTNFEAHEATDSVYEKVSEAAENN